ncbi:hypothetical protein S83_031301 [Arachis hypogaea]
MHGGVGKEHRREECLRGLQPYVAHDDHVGVVVHVEKREPLDGVAEDDEECVHELKDLGEVEDVGPKEDGPSGLGLRWEADDPVDVRCMGDGGEEAAKGHYEGEEEEGCVVDG